MNFKQPFDFKNLKKQLKKRPAGKKKTPANERTPSAQPEAKRAKLDEAEEDVDRDFCILCLKPMPLVLNHKNS